jgi:Tfp pilus assembly protein PilO
MNKLSKEKQQQLIFVGFITAIVVGLLYAFVIRAQANAKTAKLGEIENLTGQVEQASKLKKESPDVLANLETEKTKLDAMEKNMASGDLYSWVILTVNKFKIGYNVDIPNFSREERTSVGIFADFPYEAVKYTLKGSAYYHDLGKFLADFENAFPYIRVQNLDLSPEGGSSNGAEMEKLSFKLELVVPLKTKEASK